MAFYSRRLNSAEENYSATDRELLAIIASLKYFCHYVSGLDFTVLTDHQPLTYFFAQTNLNKRQVRWLETLAEFMPGLTIRYQQGKINIPADLLSRRPDYEADDAPQLALTSLVSQLESGEVLKALVRDQLLD